MVAFTGPQTEDAGRNGRGCKPQDDEVVGYGGRVLFVLVVCSVYLGMNWYVLARLFRLFALRQGSWFYLALVALTLSLIAALALESTIGNRLTGVFYMLAVVWLASIFT